jgi:bifunctional non-homologous end joining protein LigD
MTAGTAVRVGRRVVELGRPDKVLFPDSGITKADLAGYYRLMASTMVSHLRGRPLMLARFPDGIKASGFYQKEVSGHFPDWVHRVKVPKAGGWVTHAVCDDAATLVFLADQACITLHPWLSRADRLDRPDRLVFDLDPSGPLGPTKASGDRFGWVRAAAGAARDLLEDLGLIPFLQTTGSRGLHVVAPLDRGADFDATRGFARDVATVLAAGDPERFTTEARKSKRGGRVYLDVMRNGWAQTAVAPYSVRPLLGAPVATPLDWDELADRGLDPQCHRLADVPRRVAERGDPWSGMGRRARSLTEPRRRLDRLLARA